MPRLRLAILGASPCDRCRANCCKQNGHEYAVLLEADEWRKFAPFAQDVPIDRGGGAVVVERVLPYRDGRCGFLGPDDRCTIYDDRPRNCRRFECVKFFRSERGRSHGLFLRRNLSALRAIEQW